METERPFWCDVLFLGRAVQKPSTFLLQSSPHLKPFLGWSWLRDTFPSTIPWWESCSSLSLLESLQQGEGRGGDRSLLAHIPGACRAGSASNCWFSVSGFTVSAFSAHPCRQEAVWHQLHQGSQASRLVWPAKILLREEQKRQGRALERQGNGSRWIARPA